MLNDEEQLLAPYLVLLLGKLTGWNYPTGDGGDPVTSAIERLPRPEYIAPNSSKSFISPHHCLG
ncbi:hypothetical protein [Dyella nitratireducens]|uniref:Uncharacterized protein n=1 Tax=Dyella nitratireducens TaxID=1849580 RepID=A0ABQ1G438_9GAMM|nr:hypothetical protein [Dyella nitratireducens]GGA35705.1 hypothetical protein GCM10010981_26000 [Dyella nitratireducens]GLQ41035.1 hypothetical protein GCM10007902_08850 [Dyella nitratireducens]